MAYKHWTNRGEAGQVVMATTTVLNFVPVFRRPEHAELMTDLLFRTVERYGACLTAFVIMPEHIHLLLRLPAHLDATSFFNWFKGYSASCITKELDYCENAMFSQQRGLNRRSFWQRTEAGFWNHRFAGKSL